MEDKLMKMLLEVAPGLAPASVRPESNLQADLGLQSMDLMVLMMNIEDSFGITLEDDVVFTTVEDVLSYLRSHHVAD